MIPNSWRARRFHTVGGFMMYMLGRIPAAADRFDVGGWRFEVMDIDKNRVDKVLVTPFKPDEGIKGRSEFRSLAGFLAASVPAGIRLNGALIV